MEKQETLTFYYTHCGECPNAEAEDDSKCRLMRMEIPSIWGEIPAWCPLENAPKTKTQIEGG